MSEVKKKVATKKTTSTKKSTRKESDKKEVVQDAVNPVEQMIKMMTPEMMQQFMNFMQQQNKVAHEEVVKEEKPKVNRAYLSKNRDREVLVRSVTESVVGYRSRKTGIFYKWVGSGDTEYLTIGEILEMDSNSKYFLDTPLLVVEDDEVNEGLNLLECKKIVEQFDDFETFLELPINDIKKSLESVNKEYWRTIYFKTQQAINSGTLNDFRKIRDIEKIMKCEFKY